MTGTCIKCKMTQYLNRCKNEVTAKLTVDEVSTTGSYLILQAAGKAISDIAEKDEAITAEDLLKASQFSLVHKNLMAVLYQLFDDHYTSY